MSCLTDLCSVCFCLSCGSSAPAVTLLVTYVTLICILCVFVCLISVHSCIFVRLSVFCLFFGLFLFLFLWAVCGLFERFCIVNCLMPLCFLFIVSVWRILSFCFSLLFCVISPRGDCIYAKVCLCGCLCVSTCPRFHINTSSDLMFTSILFCFPLSKLTRDFLWLVGVGLGERSELFSGVAMIPSLRGSDAKSTRRRRCTETRPSGDKVGLTLWFCSCVVVYRVCLIVWLSRPSGFRGTNEFRIVVCGLYCRLRFLYYSVSQIPSL